MRIYGKHNGRNNPAKFIVRSYMWNSKSNYCGMGLFWFILAILILIIMW
jgi:hypothetical protein